MKVVRIIIVIIGVISMAVILPVSLFIGMIEDIIRGTSFTKRLTFIFGETKKLLVEYGKYIKTGEFNDQ